jgi:hypothetical protein
MSGQYEPLSTDDNPDVAQVKQPSKYHLNSPAARFLLAITFCLIVLGAYLKLEAGQRSSESSSSELPAPVEDSQKSSSELINPEEPTQTDTPEMSQGGKYSVG